MGLTHLSRHRVYSRTRTSIEDPGGAMLFRRSFEGPDRQIRAFFFSPSASVSSLVDRRK
jgi:hypothetical protein